MKYISVSLCALLLVFIVNCKKPSEIVWEDNFENEVLNMDFWNYELGDGCPNLCGWGNNERQLYSADNVYLSDGKLIINATKKGSVYNSGKITTKGKFEFQYGTIEVKAKLPTGHGLWPAIWMLGGDIDSAKWPACGEIDIMEYVGKQPHVVHSSVHTSQSFGNTTNTKKTILNAIEEGFHTYKSVWSKDQIEFYIDNQSVYTFSPDVKTKESYPFNKPFYIILNLAIGGNFGGPEVDDSIFPRQFVIDYVKVYR